jgi:hypothetical protein
MDVVVGATDTAGIHITTVNCYALQCGATVVQFAPNVDENANGHARGHH